MHAISVNKLYKKYGDNLALNNINLQIPQGKIIGLLGPNGAGKSTFIKSIVGAIKPTSGRIEVLGADPNIDRAILRKKIGYMPQSAALYENLTAKENIAFFGALQKVENLKQKINDLLEFIELTRRANDLVYTFSGGMKKRVSLACAIIHDPQIIILDEPTAAVDPHLKLKTWAVLRQLASKGKTIFVSTHLMDEAVLCDSLAILFQGRIIANDIPKSILEKGNTELTIRKAATEIKKNIHGHPNALAMALRDFGLHDDIESIEINPDSLEAIILKLVEKQ